MQKIVTHPQNPKKVAQTQTFESDSSHLSLAHRPPRSRLAQKRSSVHIVNLISNMLGVDPFSCRVRQRLFEWLGNQFGPGTYIWGGNTYIGGGKLTTGANCFINRGCFFDFNGPVTFGDNVVVGHGATFITADHQIGNATRRAGPIVGKPIVIENGAWIGANVTILPGVVIGQGAVVGAGAVVTKNVPANTVVAGVPAKVIKELEVYVSH